MKQENGNDIYSDFVFSVEFAKDTFEQNQQTSERVKQKTKWNNYVKNI